MNTSNTFDNAMKFFVWLQGCIGIFFMYKCLSYPETSMVLCTIAGITICVLVLISALTLTNSMNQFYYDIADLDKSINDLTITIKKDKLP